MIAQRALPKNYRVAVLGKVDREDDEAEINKEHILETPEGDIIDYSEFEANYMQYRACPGELAC